MIREHYWGAEYTPLYVHVRVPIPSTHLEKTLLFHQAAKVGDLTIIKTIIARIATRVPRDESYAIDLGLNLACEYGNFEVAKFLSTRCQYFPDERGISPLHWLFIFEAKEAAELAPLLIGTETVNRLNFPQSQAIEAKTSLLLQESCTELFGTPLHWAVRARALDAAKILLDLGADVNYRVDGISPLDISVCFHLPEMVSLLLDYGAEFIDEEDGHSALHVFSRRSSLVLPFSRRIIHGSSYRQSLIDTLKVLLDRGNSIDVQDRTGDTPLLLACRSNFDDEVYIIEELLKHGANTRHRNMFFETVFTMAAWNFRLHRCNIACFKFLLENVKDVNVNAMTSHGFTALHYCTIADSTSGLLLLLKRWELSNTQSFSPGLVGMTALHMAAKLGSWGCLQILVAMKVPLEVKDALHATPLELAIIHRNPLEMKRLLDAGAELIFGTILTRRTYTTALHASVANADTPASITGQLLQHRRMHKHKCVNFFDHTGQTALHKAAYYGDIKSVVDLLDARANPGLKSKEWADYPNFTPLELVTFLLQKGSLPDNHKRFKYESTNARFGLVSGWLGFKILLEEVQIILKQHINEMEKYIIVADSSDTASSSTDAVVI
jgi:ankyrin repeat protein